MRVGRGAFTGASGVLGSRGPRREGGFALLAPVREYDLQHARIELRFDIDQRKVIGHVTHTVAALQDGLRDLDFDSAELEIQSVE